MPQRRKAPSADPVEQTEQVAESVDRLSAEVRCLRQVLDEVREDFSWVTRNGLPIRPMEHVRVCRMPRDPNANDWAARLVIDRFALLEIAQTSQPDSDALEDLARNLTVAFEAVAKGQLEPVFRALDEVRTRLIAMLQQQAGDKVSEPASSADIPAGLTAPALTDVPAEESPAPPMKRQLGQLF